ncbi:MAG: AMP-binding protein [Chloroflexi bacterium]|nr:AMP-binding protein [Chloroflexota bacterium]
MKDLTALSVAWDAWRVTRGGAALIAARQRTRLARLVAHARVRSHFYAEHFRAAPSRIRDIRDLPPTTKSQLMARFDDWVTDPEVTRARVEAFVADSGNVGTDFLDRYVVFTTSGSTGEPALLVQDRRALAVMTGLASSRGLALVSASVVWRTLRGGGRQASVFATGGHFVSNTMVERRRRALWLRRRLSRFFSVLTPLPEIVRELNEFQPALLGMYPSMLEILADEQLAGRLHIQPAMVLGGGEWLAPATRERIGRAFGCPVYESYAASEALPLALPCRIGHMHVNADWFILEPVDAERRPVPPGERSHSVLVTNLANYVQPIIRYELGDSVILGANRCACGSPLPTIQVEGRTDEILSFAALNGDTISLPPMALATVVEESPGVRRFQVIQTTPTTLTVRLENEPEADRDTDWNTASHRVTDLLGQHGLTNVRLELSPKLPQLTPHSGKLRHVWSEVPREQTDSRSGR